MKWVLHEDMMKRCAPHIMYKNRKMLSEVKWSSEHYATHDLVSEWLAIYGKRLFDYNGQQQEACVVTNDKAMLQ